ncbi:GNAT family N-acetyltransferase [Thalassotalea ganghwensis]
MISKMQLNYREMQPQDFSAVIRLATDVHGAGYLDNHSMQSWYDKGVAKGVNASYVAYDSDKLVGFRITFAVGRWDIDQWCSPDLWQYSPRQICYFKCNTVDENYRGYGIGSTLLKLSIAAAMKQGAKAGISHLWRESPGNSAVKYFTKCGGQLIKNHPDRWNELSKDGYCCPICQHDCHCVAAEMLIDFKA